MGTPEFAVPCVEALAAHPRVALVGVVCQPDKVHGRHNTPQPPPTKVAALALGVPVFQPTRLRSGDFPAQLSALQPDLIVVTAYGRILPAAILQLPRLGCVNVHASLLPRWRGAAPLQWVVAAGDAESGVCLMQMDEGLDTGPVLARIATPVSRTDTGADLHDRLSVLGAGLLADHLDALLDGRLVAEAQDHSAATLAPILSRADGALDWSKPAVELERRVRAFYPWPGSFSTLLAEGARPELLKLFPGAEVVAQPPGPPGLIHAAGDSWTIVCGEGGLCVREAQVEGKRRMTIAELSRGYRLPAGARLGPAPAA